jgi:hypothetical protein
VDEHGRGIEPVLAAQRLNDRLGPGDHAGSECVQAGSGVGDGGPLSRRSPRALVTESAGAEESPPLSNHGPRGGASAGHRRSRLERSPAALRARMARMSPRPVS